MPSHRKALRLLGCEFADVYNKSYEVFPGIFVEAVRSCGRDTDTAKDLRCYSLPDSGDKRWLSLRTTHMQEEAGPASCILLVDDVTEEVQLEEQKRTNERLSAMRRLASGVAHEIRNPLNSINLIIDLLKKEYIPDRNHDKYSMYITTVHKEISRINAIVEEFLRFTRPPQLQPELLDVSEFFGEIETLFRPRLSEGDHTMTVNVPPRYRLPADPGQLKQVFVNLIENAIQAFDKKGKIIITGEVQGDNYEITVEDNGCGIAPEEIDHIFDIYYTTKKEGSGIGLAVVHQIITQHKGKITVQSEKGSGTKFTIQLPVNPK